jgi:hypothetical protein
MLIGQLQSAARLSGPGHAVKQNAALSTLGGERRARSGHRPDAPDKVRWLIQKKRQPSL